MLNPPSVSLTQGLHIMCKQLGFSKKKYNYYKPLTNGIFSTLGFGIAHYSTPGHTFINVIVGVLHEDVELLSFKLTGYNRLTTMQPQIGIQLGYLMPEKKYREWEYQENTDNTIMFDDLLSNIQNYAIPYQTSYKDPSVLFNAIEDINISTYFIRDRYLPILYYLRGDKQSGLRVINEAFERQLHPKQPEIPNINGAKIEIFVGPGHGIVDPSYVTFAKNYRDLPEPNQSNL